jgi:hypothetical protein
MATQIVTSTILVQFLIREAKLKSPQNWIAWREIVLNIYQDKLPPGVIDADINSGKIQSRKFNDWRQIDEKLEALDMNDKQEVMALVLLYKHINLNSSHYAPNNQFDLNVERLVKNLGLPEDAQQSSEQKAEHWYILQKENRFDTLLKVPASVKIILLDFLTRVVCLIIFQEFFWDTAAPSEVSVIIYFGIHVLVIPSLILYYALRRDKSIVKKTQALISKINIANLKVRIRNTSWHYLLIFFLVLGATVVMYTVKVLEYNTFRLIINLIVYAVYLIIIQTKFSKRQPSYNELVQQIEDKEHRELSRDLSHEENDEEIVNLEVNLKAENERMNAYVIEAALFGALAFSGYLQLVSEANLSIETINEFNFHLERVTSNYIDGSVKSIQASIDYLFGKSGIMAFLSYQLLFCSIFFLAVIASRLRFSKLTDYIDRFVQLSKSINEKEEMLIMSKNQDRTQLERYNQKIQEHLKKGYQKQEELRPIMEYMQFFRTLGIVMFFMIIITGGLLISKWISLVLLFISVLSMVYFYFGFLRSHFKAYYIAIQEFYYQSNKLIHWICWSMIFIALALRSLNLPGGDLLIIIGFLLLSLHYVMNLVIPVKFDYSIPDMQDVFGSRLDYYRFLEYLFKIALALLFIGYLGEAQHWPGRGPIIILSTYMLSFYFLLAPKYKDKKSVFGVLLGIVIFLQLQAVLFKSSYWPLSSAIWYTSIGLSVPVIIILFRDYRLIRPLIIRAFIILTILSSMFFVPFGRLAINNLTLNYELLQKQRLGNQWMYLFSADNISLMEKKEISADSTRALIKAMSTEYIGSKYVNYEVLNGIAWEIYLYTDDPLLLNAALDWSKLTLSHGDYWYWTDTYAALLYKTQQYEEALKYAELAYEKGNSIDTYQLIQDIKTAIRSTGGELDSQ